MKIRAMVMAAPLMGFVFILALGVAAFWSYQNQNGDLDTVKNTHFQRVQLSAELQQSILAAHAFAYRLIAWVANLSEEKITQETQQVVRHLDAAGKLAQRLLASAELTAEEQQMLKAIQEQLLRFRKNTLQALDMAGSDPATGAAMMQTADASYKLLDQKLDAFVVMAGENMEGGFLSAKQRGKQSLWLGLGLILAALTVSLAGAHFFARRIHQQLGGEPEIARQIMQQLAQGNVAVEISQATHYPDSVFMSMQRLVMTLKQMLDGQSEMACRHAQGELDYFIDTQGLHGVYRDVAEGTNQIVASFAEIIKQIRESAGAIDVAAREIAQGNTDLSQRTEAQAANLQATSASMEELETAVKQNEEHAHQANSLAESASEIARKGGTVVTEVVQTMDAITTSSKKISDIIGVIDGLSAQTNLLALNAAIEAARAGESGRGFAVVADEVRNLAIRSAEAAQQIKDLIAESVGRVQSGSVLAAQAGETMQEIVQSVQSVTDLMRQISAASLKQSSGIGLMSDAVAQMDQATQQNASLVGQVATAAQSMEHRARNLVQAVANFEVK